MTVPGFGVSCLACNRTGFVGSASRGGVSGPSCLRRTNSSSLEYLRVTIASALGTAANVSLCYLSASMHSQGSLAGTTDGYVAFFAGSGHRISGGTEFQDRQAEGEDRA